MRLRALGVLLCLLPTTSILAADTTSRQVVISPVDVSAGALLDLMSPEGTTRWDLTGVVRGGRSIRSFETGDFGVRVSDAGPAPGGDSTRVVVYRDPSGGDDAVFWFFPDRFREELKPGARRTLMLEEETGGLNGRLRVEAETVGVGWVHLPSGPREVALERALIHREGGANAGSPQDSLIHRWVDPLAGVVAEVRGPASPDGKSRLYVEGATVVDEVLTGAADLKIYLDELWQGTYAIVNYGWDKRTGTAKVPISSLTPQQYPSIAELLAANSWDFSANTSGAEVGQTTTPLNANETCNYSYPNDGNHDTPCGYNIPGAVLEHTDRNFDNSSLDKTNDVAQREDRAGDVTVWIRAGAQHEGKSGLFGSGESRFCYYGTDKNGKSRTQVPLWRFSHQDSGGWYAAAGDSWTGATFNCEQNIFNQVCGLHGFLDQLYSAGQLTGTFPDNPRCAGHTGTQKSAIRKAGVVTLPSGHTFNALVVENVADFCVWTLYPCNAIFNSPADEVRTVVYLWQVPFLGSVVTLQSPQTVAPADAGGNFHFTELDATNINFGLFPPKTISVAGTTQTTVSLSWDPGADTHRISGYKTYWDTDSGGATPYSFDSARNSGQVAFAEASATISGLQCGTTYYLTATSLSNFTDPTSQVTTAYESLVYPTQIYGDPDKVYPVEVQANTLANPSAEVTGLRVNKIAGSGDIEITWSAVTDPCLVGYRVEGAASPTAYGNFSRVADVGAETRWQGSTANSFFLVVARGPGDALGPWGHYGH